MKELLICDDGNIAAAVPLCTKYGIGIELQAFYDPGLIKTDEEAIGKHRDATRRIQPRSLHGCFGDLNPGSFDAMVRDVAMNRFELSYSNASQIGVNHLVLHHGYVPHTSPPDRWLQRSIAFWRCFLENKDDAIRIHVENMLELEPRQLADFVDGLDSDKVDLNLDIGHVYCNGKGDPIEWIRQLDRRIGYVHLHDNNGMEDEHLTLGKGKIPLKEVLVALEEVVPGASWAIESVMAEMEKSIEWLIINGFHRVPKQA
jgi:sugar phosphate isomerase/epimerase